MPSLGWIDKTNSGSKQDEGKDEGDVYVLCCHTRSTITICGEYAAHYCGECIDAHFCGEQVVC